MSNQQLQDQFKQCQEANDPEKWDALGMEYFKRGYVLNAGFCFKRADAIRLTIAPVIALGVMA